MWILGMDGGGTHTRVELRSRENRPIRRAEFGPFNLNSIGEDAFRGLLRRIFADCGSMADCAALCVGGAGISNPRVGALFQEELHRSGFSGRWKLCGDQEIALRGAMDCPGLILIAGTGSICFGKNSAGEVCRSGGYGHLIDDGGSGYALGRDTLSAAVRALDGRQGGSQMLLAKIYAALGLSTPEALVSWVYSPGTDKAAVAKLSRLLLETEDPTGREILERGARELVQMAASVQTRLNLQGCPIALMGGLLEADNAYRALVCRGLAPLGPVLSPAHDALWGAAQLAWELLCETAPNS